MAQSAAEAMVARDVQLLSSLHDKLYARNEWALLCVFQAMDAGGKDSRTIGIFNLSHYEEVLAVRVHPEFLARQHLPKKQREKHWKFSPSDMAERAFWDDHQAAYQAAITATAAPHAPWFVVPADHRWYARLIVVAVMIEALEALDQKLPEVAPEQQAALDVARKKLESEPG